MNKRISTSLGVSMLALLALPAVSAAQTPTLAWFQTLATSFGTLVGTLIPILIALAFLVFVWGLIKFILSAGDEAAKESGKNLMIWGVIALFVITAIWGILALLRTITGTDTNAPVYPTWATT